MVLRQLEETDPPRPGDSDAATAARAYRELTGLLRERPDEVLRIETTPGGCTEVPPSAARVLLEVLRHIAQGNPVMVTPLTEELSTQQAADLLDVSRTHVVQLLDNGALPHRKVGAHRRVTASDVLDYRRTMERRRRGTLDELTAYDQELGLQ